MCKGVLETLIIPSSGVFISMMMNSAPETESAEIHRTVMTVVLRGANMPKLAKSMLSQNTGFERASAPTLLITDRGQICRLGLGGAHSHSPAKGQAAILVGWRCPARGGARKRSPMDPRRHSSHPMTDTSKPQPNLPTSSGRCPSCRAPMAIHHFPRQLNGQVTLDICFACQGIWFDEFESAQLAPAGVLELFRLLHEHHADLRQPWPGVLRCPRCRDPLLNCLDSTRAGRFAYSRCPQRHGRFSAFSAFMIEKGFVRQLNGVEIDDLARQVQSIRCSGCGAPVDIRRDHVCSHCRSPIVILDPDAVHTALDDFGRRASRQAHTDPYAVADALIANERAKSQLVRHEPKSLLETDLADLVLGGIESVWKLLKR